MSTREAPHRGDAMEEDELGTMRSLSPSSYVICARCARIIRPEESVVVAGDALSSPSDYEQLCTRCYAALIEGEQDLPLNEP